MTLSVKKQNYLNTCEKVLKFHEENTHMFSTAKASKAQYYIVSNSHAEFTSSVNINTYNSNGDIECTNDLNGKIGKFIPSSFNLDTQSLDIYANDVSVLKRITYNTYQLENSNLVTENKSTLPNDDIQSVNNDLDDEIPF